MTLLTSLYRERWSPGGGGTCTQIPNSILLYKCSASQALHLPSPVMASPINPFRGISSLPFLLPPHPRPYAIIFLKHRKVVEFLHCPAPQRGSSISILSSAEQWLGWFHLSLLMTKAGCHNLFITAGLKGKLQAPSQSGYLHKPWFFQWRCFLWASWVFLSREMWQVHLTH